MFAAKSKDASVPAFEPILDTIRRRLDAISNSDVISPDEGVGRGEKFGVLPMEQRKIWTLMRLMAQEVEPLIDEHNELSTLLQKEIGNGKPSRIVAAALKPEIQNAATRVEELNTQIKPVVGAVKLLKNILWNDVRTMFGAWDEHMWIDPDWTVRKQSEDDGPSGISLSDLFGGVIVAGKRR